ncbi:MAG TPA: DUF2268 domain-containing putative Zn-dependent protease [Bryobacteraceae bacterium]|jgi:hypothetical protein|nr:DUF2268 domain-containing putative Zn-dependent protease [Bryobacteraceae bacterium]
MRFLLLLAVAHAAFAQTPAATLVTTDIDNFWKAYDASQPGQREEAFDKLYLGPGSAGLQDFVKARISSAKALAAAVDQQYPKFYASVRPYTLEVGKQAPAILRYLERYRELYPEAHFPAVYFVIGRLTSGGTTSDRGLLIGAEVNSLGKDVDTSEIKPSFVRAMGPGGRIPLIVIHELTHTQAKPVSSAKVPPMLAHCISEGAADFMTELVAASSINAYSKEWADARRDELFQRFARDMAARPNDSSKWLYNYGASSEEPADLGYWIGAEICRSFYAQSKDKAQAIRNVVTLENLGTIVRNSKYAWLLDSAK